MKCSSGFVVEIGTFVAGNEDRDRGQKDHTGTDRKGQDAIAAEDGEEQGARCKAERQNCPVDPENEATAARRCRGVDPEFGEHEEYGDGTVKHHAQRKPHQEILDVVETERAHGGKQHRPEHRVGDAEAMRDLGGEGGDRHGGETSHRRVQPDHGRGDAALFHDDAEQRQAKANRNADGRNGSDRCDERRPVDIVNRRDCAGRRLYHAIEFLKRHPG